MNRKSVASSLVLALVLAVAIVATAQAFPGAPKVPGAVPDLPGKGRITQADIDFLKSWEGKVDQADEQLRKGIEAFSKGCTVVARGPAVARPPFKKAAAAQVPVAERLEALWEDLDKDATTLDRRSHSYSNQTVANIVASTSDLLSHDFYERKSGIAGGLHLAAERIAHLDCSVGDLLATYKRERANEQEDFPASIGHLEFALRTEP